MNAGTKMGTMSRPREIEPDPKTVQGRFALHLRNLIAEREWSNADLAKRTGLSRATIYNYTSGKRTPSITELVALAKAFGFKTWGELDPNRRSG